MVAPKKWNITVFSVYSVQGAAKEISTKIDWLVFNGTFSTVRLYRAFRSTYSLRFGNRNTLGVLYISYSVVDDQQHK